jgi:serine protease AprX
MKIKAAIFLTAVCGAIAVAAAFGPGRIAARSDASTLSFIVEADSVAEARSAVLAVGGDLTHELGVIDAVAASITHEQAEELGRIARVRVFENASVETAGKPGGNDGGGSTHGSDRTTDYPAVTEATRLHQQGIAGWGVGIAVLDSGSMSHASLNKDVKGNWRFFAQYDAINDEVLAWADRRRRKVGVGIVSDDVIGHGTHVQSVGVSSAMGADGSYNGIAPYASLVSVKAFDASGRGTYADVIRGIDWIVSNGAAFNVRVLNLSLSAAPRSHYWDDPLNRAVMRAWQSGIVVVASAGNTGPNPMTIGVPGNNPYIITVGAMSENYTPSDPSEDVLASFSSAGPTVEGFVKPEVVALGGHIVGLMSNNSTIATEHPEFHDGGAYFTMSGTSQSAAVVSGVAALVLEAEPALTPDMVKCKSMSSARPAVDGSGNLADSVYQQGAGMVNAYDAVYS